MDHLATRAKAAQGLIAVTLALASAAPATANDAKVLVLGLDGTRVDVVQQLIEEAKAPHIAALRGEGYLVPSTMDSPFDTHEAGWASVATGVWPVKHGVVFRNDPDQTSKSGFPDFLTAVEQLNPALNTFLAAGWGNIGLAVDGGPIFSDAIDKKFAIAAGSGAIVNDLADESIANAATDYLQHHDPDAGFVFFGAPAEAALEAGPDSPAYRRSVQRTDQRIGHLLAAIRARPTYEQERWLVLLTSGGTEPPGTALSGAAGFGAPRFAGTPSMVDIAPTVLAYLNLAVPTTLDGYPVLAIPPIPRATATVARRRSALVITVRAPIGSPNIRSVRIHSASPFTRARSDKGRAAVRGRDVTVRPRASMTRGLTVRVLTQRPIRAIQVNVTDASGRVVTRHPSL